MPNFSFHIRHGNHSSDHKVDLPDARAAHEEATMIFGDLARDVAAQLNETPEWRMDVSDEFGKSLFRLRLLAEPLE
jgi:glucuronate isomerase